MDDSNLRETDSIPSEDVAIRLPIEFDPAKLIKDLEAVKHVDLARKPGEFWYGDFSLPHWVKNGSSIIRIHMVIDVEITDWVLTLFPREFIERVASRGDGIAKHRDPIPTTAAELAPFVCDFRMPPEV